MIPASVPPQAKGNTIATPATSGMIVSESPHLHPLATKPVSATTSSAPAGMTDAGVNGLSKGEQPHDVTPTG